MPHFMNSVRGGDADMPPLTKWNGIAGYATAKGQRVVDNAVALDKRYSISQKTVTYASEYPFAFWFVIAQLCLAVVPLLLFASFIGTVAFFAFGAALVFTLFSTAVALAVLTPVLCFTFAVAVGVWIWGLTSFMVARWVHVLWTQRGGGVQNKQMEKLSGSNEKAKLVNGDTQ
ncbi:hypothetical protein B0T14DRAFT_566253 [Immersiella caudata]|uniref:Uncharacterized protein n=1 Tax=Immersiella caudata TaxID=314043 RepID=A0AA39WPV1_9PEZI|nr:hypothetical protein B0T14DRAFT_566253 [Immersiella caudata]